MNSRDKLPRRGTLMVQTLVMATLALGQTAVASDSEHVDREIIRHMTGKGIDQDYSRACREALEQAAFEAIKRSTVYVENTMDVLTLSQEGMAGTPSQRTVQQTRAIQQGLARPIGEPRERARTLTDPGLRQVECTVTSDFEIDSASVQAYVAARQAKLARQTATDTLMATLNGQLKKNADAFQALKANAAAWTPPPQRVTRTAECAHKDYNACERVIQTELQETVRTRLAQQLSLDARYIDVTVKAANESREYYQVSPGRDRLNWSAHVSYQVHLEDPWATENASLQAQLKAPRQVDADDTALLPVTDTTPVRERARQRDQRPVRTFSVAVLASLGCDGCSDLPEDFKTLHEATIGGDGLLVQAIYRGWVGLTTGVLREKSVFCSMTELQEGEEICADTDSINWHSLAVGPYLAWGPITFEVLKMQPLTTDTLYGMDIPEDYWLGRISGKYVRDDDRGFTLTLGATYRLMPEYTFLDWRNDIGFIIDIGYTF